jgi:hypothetical protein
VSKSKTLDHLVRLDAVLMQRGTEAFSVELYRGVRSGEIPQHVFVTAVRSACGDIPSLSAIRRGAARIRQTARDLRMVSSTELERHVYATMAKVCDQLGLFVDLLLSTQAEQEKPALREPHEH